MCGSEGQLYKTEVEGATLTLCQKCSKHGKVLSSVMPLPKAEPRRAVKAEAKVPEKETILIITGDYAVKVKQAREKLGLKQEEFARQINEKLSTIHHIETGKFEPSLKLARKLEKTLRIKLIEEHEEPHGETKKEEKREHFTLGDFIKVK